METFHKQTAYRIILSITTWISRRERVRTRRPRSGLKVVRRLTVAHQLSKSKLKFSKSSPELKFPFPGGGRVAHQLSNYKLQFSKSSPELKFPFPEGGGVYTNFQNLNWNFLSLVLSWNFHFRGGGGGSNQVVFKCSKSNLHRGRLFHQ